MNVITEKMTGAKLEWQNIPVPLPIAFNGSGQRTLVAWPSSVGYLAVKRLLDVVLGTLFLLLSLPMLIVAAAAIKLTSPGPVFFRQRRAGLFGRPFTGYRLRTMVETLDDEGTLFRPDGRNGPAFPLKGDPRITPVGKFLRKTRIDEIPQFLNVILGDMSLVGPRPLPLEQVRLMNFEEQARVSVKPGLVGLGQISGRADVPYEEWLAMDLYYVQHRELWLDLLILLRTLPAVLSCKGAY